VLEASLSDIDMWISPPPPGKLDMHVNELGQEEENVSRWPR